MVKKRGSKKRAVSQEHGQLYYFLKNHNMSIFLGSTYWTILIIINILFFVIGFIPIAAPIIRFAFLLILALIASAIVGEQGKLKFSQQFLYFILVLLLPGLVPFSLML